MGLIRRVKALFQSGKLDAEIEDELRFHIGMRTQANVRDGMQPEQAERDARRRFGNSTVLKEETREMDLAMWCETTIQDVRFAWRTLRKNRAVTLVALLTLALGVGANTALFSLLNAVVLRDLPVPHPEQLVRVGAHQADDPFTGLSLPMFEEIARQQKVFSSMLAWSGDAVDNVETDGVLSRGDIWAITGNYQSELGAVPVVGRLLRPEDVNLSGRSALQVAVLGYGFWQRHYGGARDAIGKTMKIEGVPFTIVGVTGKGFRGVSADDPPEVMIPLTAAPLLVAAPVDVRKHLERRDALWLEAAGRLKPGVTLRQARAQLDALWPGIRQTMTPLNGTTVEMNHVLRLILRVESGAKGASYFRTQFAKPLTMLLAIAAAVLLLACVNLAGLLLARAAARGHELEVRVALGAGRGRLARQMLTESLLLSLAGALGGFALASWGSSALANFVLGQIFIVPAELNLSPDWRVFGFTAGLAILTGVLFGLAPAWRALRSDAHGAAQQGTRSVASGTGLLGKALIVAQVALSLMLLASAGLFVRSLNKLHAAQPGFRTQGILTAGLFPKPGGYQHLAWANYYRELTEQVASLPGVTSVGIVHGAPGGGMEWIERVRAGGLPNDHLTDLGLVMPGAFRTLGIELLRGRSFRWSDDEKGQPVAIVSEKLARELFPRGDAIGRHIDVTTHPEWRDREIVGVVSDVSWYDVRKRKQPMLYLAAVQYGDYAGWSDILVQTRTAPLTMAPAVRRAVDGMGHEYVSSFGTVEQWIDRSLLRERVTTMLSSFFGFLGLLLAAIGLYGLMSYNVTRRSREIAIRMAIGAQRRAVLGMVLKETLTLALIGILAGVLGGLAAAKLIGGMLYGVTGHDPATLAAVSAVLLLTAVAAGFIPARRAMQLDPNVALRE